MCGLGGIIIPPQNEQQAFFERLNARGANLRNQADIDRLFTRPEPQFNIHDNLPGIAVFPSGIEANNTQHSCLKPVIALGDRAPSDVQTHELMHTFGAVQDNTPHGSLKGHCTDEFDLMCYKDETKELDFGACPDPSHNYLLDCNNDDYFSTNPKSGSFLSKNWNIANSRFFIK